MYVAFFFDVRNAVLLTHDANCCSIVTSSMEVIELLYHPLILCIVVMSVSIHFVTSESTFLILSSFFLVDPLHKLLTPSYQKGHHRRRRLVPMFINIAFTENSFAVLLSLKLLLLHHFNLSFTSKTNLQQLSNSFSTTSKLYTMIHSLLLSVLDQILLSLD